VTGLIALLTMPIIIKIIVKGMVVGLAMSAIATLAAGIAAKGELCALMWLPSF
jgi:hypothetical protein